MQEIKITLPRLHPAQQKIKAERRRFNVMDCGRRFGKNVLMQDLAVQTALADAAPVGWGAPTYKMLLDDWKTLSNTLALVTTRRNEQEKSLDIVSGGRIEFFSLDNANAVRGKKFRRFIINEAAYVPDLVDMFNLVIRPTLIDLRGEADIGGTPKGLNGFWQLYRMEDPDWMRWHYPSAANPHLPPEELEAMKSGLPERAYRQEIEAEFIEDGGYFQNVDKAATIDLPDKPEQHAGHHCVMGVDWALSNDYTVLTVGCRDCNRVVVWERFNQIDFTYQRERLYGLYDRWKCRGVLPERNSIGEPNIEIIRARVNVLLGPDMKPGFQTMATTKPPLIEGLAKALEHDGFLVPKDYADELRSYEVEQTTGNPKFSAPQGMHDDRVISLALCRYAMVKSAIQIFI